MNLVLFRQAFGRRIGGAALSLVLFGEALARRGHHVTMLTEAGSLRRGTPLAGRGFRGVRDGTNASPELVAEVLRDADALISQLVATPRAIALSRQYNVPLVHYVHDEGQLDEVRSEDAALVLFNSSWLQTRTGWTGPQCVLHPLVVPEDYQVAPNPEGAVTQVSLSERKGGALFWELARRCPQYRFLAVQGREAHSVQSLRRTANVSTMAHTADMRTVYRRARVMLCPSEVETFGRIGLEAAASGIPTLAHPTEGLQESLGAAGIFCDRDDPQAWVDALARLDDPEEYARASQAARARFAELQTESLRQMDAAEQLLAQAARPVQVQVRDPHRIDVAAKYTHWCDHMAPVWRALPEEARGEFLLGASIAAYARERHGISGPTYNGKEDFQRLLAKRRGAVIVVAAMGDARAAFGARRRVVLFQHGVGFSFHGEGQHHQSYAGGCSDREVDLFCYPNEYAAQAQLRVYPRSNMKITGSPKMDAVFLRPPKPRGDPPVICISFHWNCRVCPETRWALPHYRKALPALVEHFGAGNVLGHGHPRAWRQLLPIFEEAGLVPVQRFEEVLDRADLYCNDSSSTLYEFAATDRPVVTLNAPWFRRDVSHGLRFWEHEDVGIICDHPDDLIESIELALEELPEQQARRRAAVAAAYPVQDGTAAHRAAVLILQLAAEAPRKEAAVAQAARGGATVRVAARRTFMSDAGLVARNKVLEVPAGLAQTWLRRGLVDVIDASVPAEMEIPEARAAVPGPTEFQVESGVKIVYKHDDLPEQEFASAQERDNALREAGKA